MYSLILLLIISKTIRVKTFKIMNVFNERCIPVKYLYPVIYWRLYKVGVRVRVGVRIGVGVGVGVGVGDRSYNMRGITIVVSYWNC